MVGNPLDRSTSSCSQLMGLKEESAWAAMKNKYNIEEYFSRNEGHLYFWDNLRASKYWLDSRQILFLLKLNTKSIFTLCNTRLWGILLSPTTTQSLSKLTLVTMSQEVPHGKPMEYSFRRPRSQLGQYGKPPLHNCHPSLNYGE